MRRDIYSQVKSLSHRYVWGRRYVRRWRVNRCRDKVEAIIIHNKLVVFLPLLSSFNRSSMREQSVLVYLRRHRRVAQVHILSKYSRPSGSNRSEGTDVTGGFRSFPQILKHATLFIYHIIIRQPHLLFAKSQLLHKIRCGLFDFCVIEYDILRPKYI